MSRQVTPANEFGERRLGELIRVQVCGLFDKTEAFDGAFRADDQPTRKPGKAIFETPWLAALAVVSGLPSRASDITLTSASTLPLLKSQVPPALDG